jgi:branched-chain amino acid transport system substrate-binding protein
MPDPTEDHVKRTSRTGRLGAAVALSLALTACGGGDGGGGDEGGGGDGTYVLGAALPLTGGQGALGEDFLTFMQYGVEAANEKYAADGIKLEVVAEDTQATAEVGASAFNKLAAVNSAPFVVTGWSPVVKAIAPMAEDLDVAVVNAAAGDSDLEGASPNLANFIPLNSLTIKAMATYVAEELDKKRAAIIFIDNASGQSSVNDYTEAFEAAGGEVVAVQSIEPGAVDASSQVAKIAAENPDTVQVQTLEEGGAVIRALQEAGLDVQVTMQTGVAQDAAVRTAAGDAMDGAVYAAGFSIGTEHPTMAELVERYKEEHDGRDPSVLSYMTYQYDSAFIYAEAIKRLLDADKDVTGANIMAELSSGETFETPLLGEVAFDENLMFTPPTILKKIVRTSSPVSEDKVLATIE